MNFLFAYFTCIFWKFSCINAYIFKGLLEYNNLVPSHQHPDVIAALYENKCGEKSVNIFHVMFIILTGVTLIKNFE
jgi:hypothetical protein